MMNIVYLDRLLRMPDKARATYQQLVNADNSPSRCTQCGQCDEKCTQHLKIIEELAYLVERFDKKD